MLFRDGSDVARQVGAVPQAQLNEWLRPHLAPAAKPAKTEMSPEKKAISKACSDQANAKNLHGKERKKFRAECKRKGGKME